MRIGTILAIMVAASLAAAAAAAQEHKLSLATLQGPAQPSHKGIVRLGQLLEERTDGELGLEIFGDGQLGTEQETLEGVQLGTVDMFMGSAGAVGRFLPKLEAFAHPYVWRDTGHLMRVARGPIGDELSQELIATASIRVLDLGWVFGQRHLTTRQTSVRAPADMAGLKVRVQPSGVYLETIRAMGGSPTPMDFKEVYTSLQTGVLDGQENPLNVIATRAFYEVQDYLVLTGHITQNQAVVIGEAVFQSLSPEHQAALTQAVRDAGDYQNELLANDEAAQLQLVRGKGMTVVEPDVAAFRSATADVHTKFDKVWGVGFFERLRDAP